MNKNDVINVTIDDIGIHGEGIGKVDGFPLFVKNALPGDTVHAVITKVRPKFAYAKAIEITDPSPDRVIPKCPVAGKCGGCQIQELSYEKQLEFKQRTVREKLIRIGGFDPETVDRLLEPIRGMDEPWRFRNKAQYPVAADHGRVKAGFYAGRTHHLIEQDDCLLEPAVNAKILEAVLNFVNERKIPAYDEEKGTGILRHIMIRHGFTTKEILLCLIVRKYRERDWRGLADALEEIGLTSIAFSVQPENNNVIMGNEIISVYGKPYIEDRIGEVRYRISPKSFYQVNPAQTKVLYDLAKECAGLTGQEMLIDLYCGIGTIGLYLADSAQLVRGVEVIPEAVGDARANAELNHIENAEFMVGDAGDAFGECLKDQQGTSDDLVVVVDPPRKGCSGELLDEILKASPNRIVYVSCDPATLARDLKILCEKDYTIERIIPVDQFCHSVHVECVVLMSKTNT